VIYIIVFIKMSSYLPIYVSQDEPTMIQTIVESAKNFIWSIYQLIESEETLPIYNISYTISPELKEDNMFMSV
jgi:hypothetical protein